MCLYNPIQGFTQSGDYEELIYCASLLTSSVITSLQCLCNICVYMCWYHMNRLTFMTFQCRKHCCGINRKKIWYVYFKIKISSYIELNSLIARPHHNKLLSYSFSSDEREVTHFMIWHLHNMNPTPAFHPYDLN